MEIKEYLKILFKNKWIILVSALLGFCLAIVYNQNVSQKLNASAFVYVSLFEKTSPNSSVANSSVNDFSDNLVGLVNGGVIKVSNANVSAKKISPQILNLNSDSSQNGLAASALKEIVDDLNSEGQKLISPNQILLIKFADENISESKNENKKFLNVLIGLMAGSLIGIGLVGLKYYFEF